MPDNAKPGGMGNSGKKDGKGDRNPLWEKIRICELTYKEGKSGKAVAQELNLSEATVSRRLKEAWKEQLIRFSICPPRNTLIAGELKSLLAGRGVREVIVPEGHDTVGYAAARLFEDKATSGSTVVLDGGKTVASFVDALAGWKFERMVLVPICADPASYEVSAYEMMTRMAAVKYPTLVRCMKLPHLNGPLLRTYHEEARTRAAQADWVFLGVGPWEDGFTALEYVKHVGEDPGRLREDYPGVACMCGYLALDPAGVPVPIPRLQEKMPRALDFDHLKGRAASQECSVVLLAAGGRKTGAVDVVTRAGLCNTLVLDEELARQLLELVTGRGTDSVII
jgi:DNA-binding transcriptional regulator LsrR (DeoR family)